MGSKRWFLVRWESGRMEIVSMEYESYEDAKKEWDEHTNTTICETVFG